MTKGRRPSVSGRSLDPRLQLVHLSQVLRSGNMNRDLRRRASRRQSSSWAGDQTANGFDIARRGERQYHPFRPRRAHNENHPSARGGGLRFSSSSPGPDITSQHIAIAAMTSSEMTGPGAQCPWRPLAVQARHGGRGRLARIPVPRRGERSFFAPSPPRALAQRSSANG